MSNRKSVALLKGNRALKVVVVLVFICSNAEAALGFQIDGAKYFSNMDKVGTIAPNLDC